MKFNHSSERSFCFEPPLQARSIVESSTRCFCFSNSDSKTTDQRSTATDNAQVAATGGALTNSGPAISGANANLGLQIEGNSGAVHIETSDPDVLAAALGSVSDLATRTLKAQAESADKNAALLTSLAEAKQTEGFTQLSKMIIALAVAAAVVLAVKYWKGR